MLPYEKELVQFIEQNCNKYYTDQLVILIEQQFGKKITTKALRKYFYRHNLTFKRRYNRKDKCVFARDAGFESPPDKNGLIRIKINDKQWQYKQRYLYEKYNNTKLSENYVVIFADGNKNNFAKENLIAVPKQIARAMYVLTRDDKPHNKDLTQIGLQIAEIKTKTKHFISNDK